MNLIIAFLLLMGYFLQDVNSARILAIVPTASYSHQMFFQQLWRELAVRGHDMVVITTDPTGESLPNFKEISVKESYPPTKKLIQMMIDNNMFSLLLQDIAQETAKVAEHQINLPQVQEIFNNKSEHFDLLMIEYFANLYVGLKQRFSCPLIGVNSLDSFGPAHEIMGNPTHSILYPTSLLPYQDDLTFWQRLAAVVLQLLMERMNYLNTKVLNNLGMKIYDKHTPSIMNLYEEVDMLFVNANPLFTPIRPLSPSTINLAGGIHLRKPQPLPKNLKDFLDSAPNGVIYFSLGSNVISKDLSTETRQIFLDTLSQLPYKILWKFEDDSLPGKPANVMITKWAPQQDILRHPNVKLFITQGGIQSLEEALYSYIPMVVMPFLGDQEANAAKVKAKGLGLTLDPHSLTVENFKATILEVIENKMYRENVKQLAARIQDSPMTALERAVWWTEYVLRHKGAQHLKGPRIPYWQYYYFDVLAFIVVVVLVLLGIVYGITRFIIRRIRMLFTDSCRNRNKDEKSKKIKTK